MNTAFRTTMFLLHEQLKIDHGVTSALAGHSSDKTQLIYKRLRRVTTASADAALLTSLSGVAHGLPEQHHVKLLNGKTVEVKVEDFMKHCVIESVELPDA